MSIVLVPCRASKLLLLLALAILLWFNPSEVLSPVDAAGPFLYVTNYGDTAPTSKLLVSNTDGSNPTDKGNLSGNLNGPTGIAIDVKNTKMYIANYWSDRVIKANLDGTSPTLVNFGAVTLDKPMGLALDQANGKIYVVNYGTGPAADTIVKANLDGSSPTKLDLGGNLTQPWAIALDTANKIMYVTSFGTGTGDGKVVRADLDGGNVSTLTFDGATVDQPAGIALDFVTNKLYITNYDFDTPANNRVIQSNLDGSNAIDLGNPGKPAPLSGASGIVVDRKNQYLYIAFEVDHKVVRTDLDGGNATDLTTGATWASLLSSTYFFALDEPPDMMAMLSGTVDQGVPAGSGFSWGLSALNSGIHPAVFTNGQVILRDNLPAGPTYTLDPNWRTYRVTNTGNVVCSLASNVLTCSESGGTASFAPGYSSLTVLIKVLTHAAGTLNNPSGGGICRADPDHVTGDTYTVNNDCSDSMTAFPPSIARGQKLYVLNNYSGAVSRANLDGTSGMSLGNAGGLVEAAERIALDLVHEKMYITNALARHVIRANLDGSGGTDLGDLNGLLAYPNGIALDVANNRMYVSNWTTSTIVWADLNGNGAKVFANLAGTVNGISDIALDLVHGRIYVVGTDSDNLYRLNLAGGGGTNLGNLGGKLDYPRGVAVDPDRQLVFVTSDHNRKVVRANWDGTGVADFGNVGGLCTSPLAIAVASNTRQFFVTCFGAGYTVVRANLDNTSPQNLGNLNDTLTTPIGIAVDTRGTINLPLLRR